MYNHDEIKYIYFINSIIKQYNMIHQLLSFCEKG